MGSRTWQNIVWAGCIASALIASAASAAPITDLTGRTLACFDAACSVLANVSDADFGVAFSAVDPFQATLVPGQVATVNLGTVTRNRNRVSSSDDALLFALQVIFTLPTGIPTESGRFTASIFGTTPGGGGPVAFDFDNSWHRFTTPAGTFEFALSDAEVTKNGTAALIGTVRAVDDGPRASIPEPATLMVVGLGLLGAAALRRRR